MPPARRGGGSDRANTADERGGRHIGSRRRAAFGRAAHRCASVNNKDLLRARAWAARRPSTAGTTSGLQRRRNIGLATVCVPFAELRGGALPFTSETFGRALAARRPSPRTRRLAAAAPRRWCTPGPPLAKKRDGAPPEQAEPAAGVENVSHGRHALFCYYWLFYF
jgi:hypothetical protein